MKKSQLIQNYKSKVLFQNNCWSIELTQNNNFGNNEFCLVHNAINTDWVTFNKNISIVRLSWMTVPKYICDNLLRLAKKHSKEIQNTIY